MRDAKKQAQIKNIMTELGAGGSRLDYVTAWFLKAGAYFKESTAQIAFVATNSITQGEQVAQLWPVLVDRYNLEITFAHRTFSWGSDARGKAHVHVVIVGLSDSKSAPPKCQLFSYENSVNEPDITRPNRISPYLVDASQLNNPHLVVNRQRKSISGLPKISVGTKPVDGGHYILDREEKEEFLMKEPEAANLLKPFIGGREYINGIERWLLHVSEVSPSTLRSLPSVMNRIRSVKEFRMKHAGKLGKSLAEQPTMYHVTVVPTDDFLVIPEVSSEHRVYIPIGYLKPPVIPSNKLLVVQDATLPLFALLTSTMHMVWMRHVGGRLESRYQYSSGLVYNSFPAPPGFASGNADFSKLELLAQAVLDARAAHPNATLADLYDSDLMPLNLRQAHKNLDRNIDRLYSRTGFASERERIEHLFILYEKMWLPLEAGMKKKPRGRGK